MLLPRLPTVPNTKSLADGHGQNHVTGHRWHSIVTHQSESIAMYIRKVILGGSRQYERMSRAHRLRDEELRLDDYSPLTDRSLKCSKICMSMSI